MRKILSTILILFSSISFISYNALLYRHVGDGLGNKQVELDYFQKNLQF